jgi:hypothetical protein
MTDLIAFVKARLDEDQKTAEAAAELCGCHPAAPVWTHIGDPDDGDRIVIEGDPHSDRMTKLKLTRKWSRTYQDLFHGRHIARHDPKAVLADIAFKRQLLVLFDISNKEGFGGSDGWVLIRDAVYQLAALWSDHKEYNPNWKTSRATPKFAEGGLVTGPGGLVGGTGCVIRFDPRVERVFTAEDMRSPEAQAVLEKLNKEVRARPTPTINTNDFEPPKDPAVKEFEAQLRRAIKESD